MHKRLAQQMGAFDDNIHLVDGIPIPLRGFSRAPQCRFFKGEASYSYCLAKKQTYYGFHGHLMLSFGGIITGFSLTSANTDEREALWDLLASIRGLVIGDKGYRCAV